MKINFDKLHELDALQASEGPENPSEVQSDHEEITGLAGLYRREESHREQESRTAEVYNVYQSNIKDAGTLRAEILKGIQNGTDAETLLMLAVRCIAQMTGDPHYFDACTKAMKNR